MLTRLKNYAIAWLINPILFRDCGMNLGLKFFIPNQRHSELGWEPKRRKQKLACELTRYFLYIQMQPGVVVVQYLHISRTAWAYTVMHTWGIPCWIDPPLTLTVSDFALKLGSSSCDRKISTSLFQIFSTITMEVDSFSAHSYISTSVLVRQKKIIPTKIFCYNLKLTKVLFAHLILNRAEVHFCSRIVDIDGMNTRKWVNFHSNSWKKCGKMKS